jgi:hypothetical protein
MALGGLLPRRPSIGPVVFQCSVRETYSLTSQVTSNPVSFGGVITDHVQPQPRQITLDVIASPAIASSVGAGLGLLARGGGSLSVYQGPGAAKRTVLALEALWRSRIPVDVVTGEGIFPRFVIESITYSRDAMMTGGLFGSLEITITLREIVIALVDAVENVAEAASDLAIGGADIGTQGTEVLPVEAF